MSKRIVICCDGTWNTSDQKDGKKRSPSNVVKLARSVAPEDPTGMTQVVFYDEGVGSCSSWLDRFTGGSLGGGLAHNVEVAYRFLVDNYAAGDEIFLFGFSRGAYTVRSTCGMIRKCGLLQDIHADRFPEAYALYRRKDPTPDTAAADEFRKKYARDVAIKFLGVWDTVGALGIPSGIFRSWNRSRHEFHDVKLSSKVRFAYQALAIDEKRRPFQPTIWENCDDHDQTVEQVWFAGVHSNVGGGYRDAGLSDLALEWMCDKAGAAGLWLDGFYLAKVTNPDSLGALRSSMTWYYRTLGEFVRPIGARKDSREDVSPAARDRLNRNPSYRPPNLRAFLDQLTPRP